MRNRLVHAYFDVDLDILWNTAKTKLEPLIEQLDKIIILENWIGLVFFSSYPNKPEIALVNPFFTKSNIKKNQAIANKYNS